MANVMHGGRVVVKIDGRLVAEITNISIEEETPHGDVRPLGVIGATEKVPLDYSVRGSFESHRISTKDFAALGLVAKRANLQDLLNHPKRVLQVIDESDSARVLERLHGFVIEGTSTSYAHGAMSMSSVRWSALKKTTEAEN